MPDVAHAISPELVLVDPVLAERERRGLPDRVAPPPRPSVGTQPLRPESREVHPIAARVAPEKATPKALGRARAWRLPIGVGAVVVLALLLLDVHVEVGKSPASAVSGPGEVLGPASPSPPTDGTQSLPSTPELQVRRFAWAPTPGASRYRVEIFEGPVRVFVGEARRPQISVPKTWRLGGATRSLTDGEYRWYVWPIVSGRRSSRAVVQASLSIPAG